MSYAALPQNGDVVGGSATITNSPHHTEITQSTDRAIINWDSFNVGTHDSINFVQPSSSSIALNRVTGGGGASQILGQLTANGNVWIINPQGVLFGKNAQVNVGGLLATTSDISNNNFMSGNFVFDKPGNPNATITNEGSIKIADGSLAALVGPNVVNSGYIDAKLGKVALASGDTFTLDLYGDGLLNLQASPALTKQLVKNSGKIKANGGEILLTAAAAEDTINSLINMTGILQADSVGTKEGHIVLYAAGSNAVDGNVAANKGTATGSSKVLVSGTISVQGKKKGQNGGTVQVLADNVGILSGANINASGKANGGTINIGGDFHGAGTTPTALKTIVQSNTFISANSEFLGNGGNVSVWADDSTVFAGTINAKGGSTGGNGGFVETSGTNGLMASGMVDATATNGTAGMWLLDPNNILITDTTSSTNVTGNPNFTTTGNDAVVNITSIENVLNNGTNVTITTSNEGLNSQPGDITLQAGQGIYKTAGGDATLTLNAANDIHIDTDGQIMSSNGKLNMIFNADTDHSGSGSVVIGVNTNLQTNGGTMNFIGNGISIDSFSTLNAGAANVTLTANSLQISSLSSLTTTGNVAINPLTAGTTIGIRGAAGTLQLSQDTLDAIAAGSLTIGNTDAGAITANAKYWDKPVTLISNDDIVINGLQNVVNNSFTANSAHGNIVIGTNGGISTAATGQSVVLIANNGNFLNGNGANAIQTPDGNWLIYSTNPANDIMNGLASDFHRYSCAFGGACPSFPSTGNGNLYSFTPVLTLTPVAVNITYGDATPSLGYIVTGYLGSDQASDTLSGTAFITTPYAPGHNSPTANVGNYDITTFANTLASSMGYSVTGTVLTGGLSVSPATLTYVANPAFMTYGSSSLPSLGGHVSGFVNGDSLADATGGSATWTTTATAYNGTAGSGSNAGLYAIDGIGLTANHGNYNFVQAPLNSISMIVTPAILTVAVNPASMTYGGSLPTFGSTLTGFVNGDTQSGAVGGSETFFTLANSHSNVGNYAVLDLGLTANHNNYVIAQAVSNLNVLTINPATLFVTPNAVSTVYTGVALNNTSYSDNNANYTITGFVNGQNTSSAGIHLTGSLAFNGSTATSVDNAGSYAQTQGTLAMNSSHNNYVMSFLNPPATPVNAPAHDYVVTPATLTISATTDTKVYDTTTSSTQTPTFTGLVAADTGDLTGLTQEFQSKNVLGANGSTLQVSGYSLSDPGNYNVVLNTAQGTITPAALSATADNKLMPLGGPVPGLTYTTIGLLGSDTTSDVFTGALATNAIDHSLPGFYDITQGTLAANANYTLTFTPGTLEVSNLSGFVNGDLEQTASKTNLKRGGPTGILLAIANGGAPSPQNRFGTPSQFSGNLGNLAPAANGTPPAQFQNLNPSQLGQLNPSAGGPGNSGTTTLIECNSETPCGL